MTQKDQFEQNNQQPWSKLYSPICLDDDVIWYLQYLITYQEYTGKHLLRGRRNRHCRPIAVNLTLSPCRCHPIAVTLSPLETYLTPGEGIPLSIDFHEFRYILSSNSFMWKRFYWPRMSDLDPKLVRLFHNLTNPGLFSDCVLVYINLIWSVLNLSHLGIIWPTLGPNLTSLIVIVMAPGH